MKNPLIPVLVIFLLGFLLVMKAPAAVVINTNTYYSPIDSVLDGSDLVISNCTVTMDGSHSFNSLLIAPGGRLTHTGLPNGSTTVSLNVTNEPLVLTGTNPVTLLNSNVTGLVLVTDTNNFVIYTNDVDFVQFASGGFTQIYRTQTSSIPDGATVFASYSWSYSYGAGLFLNVSNNLNVASGGSLNANGCGFGPAIGTGRGFSSFGPIVEGSGASHAGRGGSCSSNATVSASYGTLYQPVTLGSGGGASYAGNGGNGGGKIQITAGGTVNIDGLIAVNGADATNARAGGGSGGSIWITATNVSGSGSLTANGGAGEPIHGGGGGGGRISIQCSTNTFAGSFSAIGGTGWKAGGAGTLFTQTNGDTGLLVLDNGGRNGTNTTVSLPTTADVIVRNGAWLTPGSFSPRHLTIGTNGILSPGSLTVSGDCIIQPGGVLLADFSGGAPGTGAGYAFSNAYCGYGASHGGYGAVGNAAGGTMGNPFDSITAPTGVGLGGGNNAPAIGGSGGGALQLSVAGTLQVDGRISANGGNGSVTAGNNGGGGGGSGGSIYISSCAVFAGSGILSANGGNGVALFGGGGGGGRIAIYATSNNFTGTLSAAGGGGFAYGGAGTIYTQFGGVQQLIADNAGHLGTNTPVTSINAALVVRNGAKVTASQAITFNSLLVSSNGWLTHAGASSLTLTINNNATIQAGGGFAGDFLGRPGGQGSGLGGNNGTVPYYPCAGGGYGGKGGNSFSNSATGGTSGNDTASSPSSVYSGSGGGNLSPSLGGSGGGFFQLFVTDTLQHDGSISASGGNGSGPGGGGGAGGGIYLTVGTLTGSGSISANGGNGATFGGGGGGGRIAIYVTSNNFSGSLAAFGGGGANYGGAGTIYLKTNNAPRGQVIVDNAGHSGADTIWNSSASTDLILRNGSSCTLPFGTSFFANLTVGTNASLIVSNSTPSSATINAIDVNLQAGGSISANNTGYAAGSGSGTGAGTFNNVPPFYSGAGGAHGGYGANSISNLASGGTYYDAASGPTLAGSGGGGTSGSASTGGRGGGVITFSLSGNLQVDGNLSANGGNGSGAGGGGGAGGALNISCAALTGAGTITANGGNGVTIIGGGGGGGMIYANFTSNSFSGTLSAYGGGGANFGGAGTIYFRTNTTSQTLLIVDNAGHRGTNTPLANANNLILRNGATAFQAFPPQSINSLLITSNAWLVGNTAPGNNYPGIVNLTINGAAIIQNGGGIYSDASGSTQNAGTGHGGYTVTSPWYACSGGGHGGWGAAPSLATFYNSMGSSSYDSTTTPTLPGSGGGGTSPNSIGGGGGGFIRLIFRSLQLDGTITANGGNGSGIGGGGGSGGTIYLNSDNGPGFITGAGTISANGGNGAIYGGGGGGGRIAVYFDQNNFTGKMSAFGGGGYAFGGAGTIYTKTNSANYAQLLLDNANNLGTNTSFDFIGMDVTVQNRAIGLLPANATWSPHDVLIRTNATLASPGSTGLAILNANNLTIDAGGALALDSGGNGSGSGFGSGYSVTGVYRGGGGYGGYGGGNPVNYGKAYGSIQSPTSAGSGGGNYVSGPPYGNGGAGGGALQMNVSGRLTVNGRLSANGGNGDYNCGGGSGGSLYLTTINQLAGIGVISANGGSSGGGNAGGGGGGRISVTCNSNSFTGQITATGGNGLFPGGAGTVYTRFNGLKTLLVDNGGLAGTNTPLDVLNLGMPAPPYELNISGGSVVVPTSPLSLISNLNLAAGSSIVMPAARSQLVLAVQHNANLAGNISVDYLGYAQGTGPGAGTNLAGSGSGGGYGGSGGNAASGATGGVAYGAAATPTDFGSGGGTGANANPGGSAGGGAVRISVGGNLNIDGNLSANGDSGWQDSAGGGAGGSLWISANSLTGLGMISAAGGNGDLWNGGGGGGGRIAIYSPTNLFAGITNVSGGLGSANGQTGTLFFSATTPSFVVTAQLPTGIVSNTVSYVDLAFNEAVDPASVSAAAFSLNTPAGVMNPASLSAGVLVWAPAQVRVSFPVQNLIGNYSLQIAPMLTNILGQPLAQPYTANFTISLPTISGSVNDTNGAPVAGVLVQPDGGLIGSMTDSNGNYSIGVPPGWSGGLTPSLGQLFFIPGTLGLTNVTVSLTNQNFLMLTSITPTLGASLSDTNCLLNWNGIAGVTYQVQYSSDLINWTYLYPSQIPGTNGLMQFIIPMGLNPSSTAFFRLFTAH